MVDPTKEKRKSVRNARLFTEGGWIFVPAIVCLPGVSALTVGTTAPIALVVSAFTALCIAVAWIAIGPS